MITRLKLNKHHKASKHNNISTINKQNSMYIRIFVKCNLKIES